MEILDASVGLKWALTESDSDKARQLREDFRNAIREFLAHHSRPESDYTPRGPH